MSTDPVTAPDLKGRGAVVHLLDNLTAAMVRLRVNDAPDLWRAVGDLHAALHAAYDDGSNDAAAFVVAEALTKPYR